MKRDFRSKVVVITGGGGGIGSAAGKLFCEAGATVALVDLDASAANDAAARVRDEVPGADIQAGWPGGRRDRFGPRHGRYPDQ